MNLAQRFARLSAVVVSRYPSLWPLFRGPVHRMFDVVAPQWDADRSADRTTVFEAALDVLPVPPRRALDLGTGTGDGALVMARRWPQAEVLGIDLSERMVAEARAKAPPELGGRVRFEVADASRVPVTDGWADVVALNNMIPFFDELARVTAPGAQVVVAFSQGPRTPIYVPNDRLRAELERRGFADLREVAAGPGTAVVARRGGAGDRTS